MGGYIILVSDHLIFNVNFLDFGPDFLLAIHICTIYIADEVLRGSCFLLFPDGILHMEVERDNNEYAWKKKPKGEKWNDIDTSKAVRSYIEAERGFYMLMVCWRALHLKESFLYYYYYFGSDNQRKENERVIKEEK